MFIIPSTLIREFLLTRMNYTYHYSFIRRKQLRQDVFCPVTFYRSDTAVLQRLRKIELYSALTLKCTRTACHSECLLADANSVLEIEA